MAEVPEPASSPAPERARDDADPKAALDTPGAQPSRDEGQLPYWSTLTKKQKWWRAAAIAVVLLHGGSVLMTGAPKWLRDPAWFLVAWYADGLRMTNKWGMFSKPPRRTTVSVIADRRGQESYTVAHNLQAERGFTGRVVDARIRKILGNVARDDNHKRYGTPILAYYCRVAREVHEDVWRVRVRVDTPAALDDNNQTSVEPSTKVLMNHVCRGTSGG